MREIKKIVVIGPESTGKSSLCQQLAAYYHTSWCPEYAREYLLKHGTDYRFDDLFTIAKGQLQLEDEYSNALQQQPDTPPILIIDTDMYVMKVWCEYVFGKCHPFILEEIAVREYDLYLLCNTDIPWVDEVLREYPDEAPRKELFKIYTDLLIHQNTPWVIISGSYEQRLATAIQSIDSLLVPS